MYICRYGGQVPFLHYVSRPPLPLSDRQLRQMLFYRGRHRRASWTINSYDPLGMSVQEASISDRRFVV